MARGDTLRTYSRADLREIDRRAAAEFGVPTLLLMESAARGVAEATLDGFEVPSRALALVVCGTGNNAGDGLAAARHLHNAGVRVRIVLALGDRLNGDAGVHLDIAKRMGLKIVPPDDADAFAGIPAAWGRAKGEGVVIDALFGTGLSRSLAGPALRAVRGINALGARGVPVLAVDVPSGLDADSGDVLGDAVCADVTITFVGLKPGFLNPAAGSYLGDVIVADIGAPRALVESLGTTIRRAPSPRAKRRA